jgi:hypothetical protein
LKISAGTRATRSATKRKASAAGLTSNHEDASMQPGDSSADPLGTGAAGAAGADGAFGDGESAAGDAAGGSGTSTSTAVPVPAISTAAAKSKMKRVGGVNIFASMKKVKCQCFSALLLVKGF